MNKIYVYGDYIKSEVQDEKLILDVVRPYNDFDVFKLKIVVKESTEVELYHDVRENCKIDITYIIEKNVSLKVFEIRNCKQLKAKYTYNLEAFSQVDVVKFYDCKEVKELSLIQLNEEYSSIKHTIKTIANNHQRFDIITYHNAQNTISDVKNHGVTIGEGKISFQVTSVVYPGMKNCMVDQNNRIVTMNHEKSEIHPILLIEENDIVANHSAYIGKFSEDAVFYLMSRGISRKTAYQLLVKGFLLNSLPQTELITHIIEQYWR